MADRVHPADGSPDHSPETPLMKPPPPPPPPAGTYIIQVPKDQVYRVPPPVNARLFKSYANRADRRKRSCRRCLLCSAIAVAVFLFLIGAAVGIVYLVLNPKLPSYSFDRLSVAGLNSSDLPLSPALTAVIRADNPNGKIRIRYLSGGSLSASYSGVKLCDGDWPAFEQGTKNVTVFETALAGSGIRLSRAMRDALGNGHVPLDMDVRVPVKLSVGAVSTWRFTVKVSCELTVVSQSCRTKVDVF